jgi:hypothetical protein
MLSADVSVSWVASKYSIPHVEEVKKLLVLYHSKTSATVQECSSARVFKPAHLPV